MSSRLLYRKVRLPGKAGFSKLGGYKVFRFQGLLFIQVASELEKKLTSIADSLHILIQKLLKQVARNLKEIKSRALNPPDRSMNSRSHNLAEIHCYAIELSLQKFKTYRLREFSWFKQSLKFSLCSNRYEEYRCDSSYLSI